MSTEKILRYTLLGGVFLIPFIPLIVASSMFFPFITGKNFTFRIITEIIFGLWVILAVVNPAYRPRFSWILGFFATFIGIIAVADIFGENPFKSFWSNFERMEGLVTLIHLFAYFVVVSSVLNVEKLWHRFWYTSIGVSVIMGLYGIFQLAGVFKINQGGVRLDATLGNATYLAVYMLFHIFITVYLLLRWRGGVWARWMLGGALLLELATLYYTATRGAILGLVGGALLAVILIAVFERQNRRLRNFAVSGLVALLIIIGGFILIEDTQFVRNAGPLARLSSISLEEGSTRFRVWNMAWQGVKERPILGWGQENFNFVFNRYYNPEMYNQEPWFDRVHNIFFDWLIAGGILGLLSYLLLYAAVLYYLWIKKAGDFSVTERSIFTGLLAGYFFHNLFVFDNIVSYILFFSLLAYLHYRFTKERSPIISREIAQGTVYGVVAPAVSVLLVAALYFFNWTGIATNVTLLKAIAPQENSPFENLELFKKAVAYDGLGRQEVKEQMMQAASQVVRSDFDDSFKSEFFTAARDAMQKEIERSENDARLLVFMGSYLNTSGDYDTALTYLERALKASPKKQAILFEMATSYLNKGDRERAFAVLEEAYELAPDYEFAKVLYAVGAIYSGQNQLAGEILAEVSISTLVQNDQLLRAYIDTGQFNNALFIWQRRVENDPNNSDFRVNLAALYLQVGERQKSIEELRKAIELNPSFKEQGESYIREIQAGGNL